MFSRKQQIILSLLLVLSAATALKLLHIDYMVNYSAEPYRSFCNVSAAFNCDVVAASEYSHLSGVPTAFFGAFGDLLLLLLLFAGARHAILRAALPALFYTVFLFKILGCIALAAISFLLMSSHCFLCMFYWALTAGAFGYLAFIQRQAGSGMSASVVTALRALWNVKWLALGLAVIFAGGALSMRSYLQSLDCPLRDPQSLQCHNFDQMTNTPFLGSEGGKLEVYTYTDFECPWCNRAHFAAADIVKRHEKHVRFIRRDFPLDVQCNRIVSRPFHAWACRAAYYARCAGQQGKYWEYHDEIYYSQRALSEETFLNIGRLLNLDLEKLEKCAASTRIKEAVAADIQEALDYSVEATPTFRIFGELFTGALAEDALNDYLRHFPAVTADMVHRIYQNGHAKNIQIIDLRSEEDFARGHLLGAKAIPLKRLISNLDSLSAARPVLLYDADGSQAGAAAELLMRSGFRSVHFLAGGYAAWRHGTPAEVP